MYEGTNKVVVQNIQQSIIASKNSCNASVM